MEKPDASADAFGQVLHEDLKQPIYLNSEEIDGGWRELFPSLATSLPAPFPIFGLDEERVVTWGYPVLLSEGAQKLRHDLEVLVHFGKSTRTFEQHREQAVIVVE